MRARCPASTSNLGPGFDALGLALSLYVEVEISPASSLTITSEGEGSDLPGNEHHLAARVARLVCGHDRLAIHVRSEIPVGRGLGSSAALAVAAAAAAGADDPLTVGAAFDGHGENAAASALGGLVGATMHDGLPIADSLLLDPTLQFVVVIPDRHLSTEKARAVLPKEVPLVDAAANLGRLALLIGGLADHKQLISEAGADRLHQGPRGALFPEAAPLMEALASAGATISCWSGAGPTMLGICTSATIAAGVRDAGEQALFDLGITGRALCLVADTTGLVVSN